MIILTIRTDKPEAEIGLYDGQAQLSYETWGAHRKLAETLHHKIADLLKAQGKGWQSIQGIVVYEGPGSFTGLRIGLSVANTLAYSLACPVVAETSIKWIETGIKRLLAGGSDKVAKANYGAAVHITTPRK